MGSLVRWLVAPPAILAFAVSVAACSPSTTVITPTDGVQVGNLATDFTLFDGDGHAVHLADYRGKVVLFEFSAMW